MPLLNSTEFKNYQNYFYIKKFQVQKYLKSTYLLVPHSKFNARCSKIYSLLIDIKFKKQRNENERDRKKFPIQ